MAVLNMTKDKMIKYITSFETYPTMNSWNNSYGYSINMKIHKLSLRSGVEDKLLDIISDDGLSSELYSRIDDDIQNWRWENKDLFGTYNTKTEKSINIDGMTDKAIKSLRKSYEDIGWTYDRHGTKIMTIWKYTDKVYFDAGFNGRSGGHLVLYRWNGHNFAGTGWNHTKEELSEMNKEEVREIYKILQSFEQLSETIIETAKALASEEVEEEEYTITKTRKVFKDR